MKLGDILGLALIALVMWPWLVGLVDLMAWLATGSQLSGIPWASKRGFVALVWPVFWAFVFAGISP